MTREALYLPAFALLAACASAPKPESGYESAAWLFKEVNRDPAYRSYVHAYQQSGDLQKRAEDSGCADKPSNGAVTLFLLVDASGIVKEAHSKTDSPAAACYRAAYAGMIVPLPPFSPLPLIVQLQR